MNWKGRADFPLALAVVLLLCSGSASATRLNAVLKEVVAPVNVSSGDSFSIVIRTKYPCYTELRVYLDGDLKGIKHLLCREYETVFEFKNSDHAVNDLQPGWHHIRVEAYDSGAFASFSDTQLRVIPKAGLPAATIAAQNETTNTSIAAASATTATTATTVTTTTAAASTTTAPATKTVGEGLDEKLNSSPPGNESKKTRSESNTDLYVLMIAAGFILVLASVLYKGVHTKKLR